MTSRFWLRTSVVLLLCLSLSVPSTARADTLQTDVNLVVAGIVIASIAIGGLTVYLILHQHSSISGCLASNSNGLTLLNEADHKTYEVAGNSVDLKGGDRVKVKGKKRKDKTGKPVFEVDKLIKDFGACSP